MVFPDGDDREVVCLIAPTNFAANFKPRIGRTLPVRTLDGHTIRMAYRFVREINLGFVILLRRRTATAEENEISQNPMAVTTPLHTVNTPSGFSWRAQILPHSLMHCTIVASCLEVLFSLAVHMATIATADRRRSQRTKFLR